VNEEYINASPENSTAFIDGDIGIQYGGSWALSDYFGAYKDDLAILPLPDFGHGTVSGGGSWHWAISQTCRYPEAATEILEFFVSSNEQSIMSAEMSGLFPTSSHAAEATEDYSIEGKWRILFEFSKAFALLRPATPAYIEIASNYRKAMINILNGMPPELALGMAVDSINVAFERNQNYRQP
jgi:multiple sugar transport system substrate-binding protein